MVKTTVVEVDNAGFGGGGGGGGASALHSCWPVAPGGKHGKRKERTKCAALGTPVNCRRWKGGGGGDYIPATAM